MNILFDIGHPAHVHLFRNLYFELKNKNHALFLTVKSNLSSAQQLLNYYKIPYITIGNKSDNIFSKVIKQLKYDVQIVRLAVKNKIHLGVGTSMNIAHASRVVNMKSIVLDDDDDEIQPLFTKFAHPFCDVLLSPLTLKEHRKRRDTVFYSGYHELAYLHTKRFRPDKDVLKEAGIGEGVKYFVLRFNSFKAHHDQGNPGLSLEHKRRLIETIKPYGKIFITTEREIEPEFKEYQINIEPHKIHSFLYYSAMFMGDSQTMTSEAALLGVPSLKCNTFAGKLSVPNELENKYGLCYSFHPAEYDSFICKIEELITQQDLKKNWENKRGRLLEDKIDVTAFLLWLIEKYPKSIDEYKTNPGIEKQFR